MQHSAATDAPVTCEALEQRLLLDGEPWGLTARLVRQHRAFEQFSDITGAGQVVVVIDSGIDYRHPALGGGLGPGFKVIDGYDFIDKDSDPMDHDGHGTAIAGIIAADPFIYRGELYRGIAPDARLIALRVDDGSSGKGADRRVERALRWVLRHRHAYNIAAVNLSVGSGASASPATQEPYADELAALKRAGIVISAASGNGGVSTVPDVEYPASHPSVNAVGAVSPRDVILPLTARSPELDLLAPGHKVPAPFTDAPRQRFDFTRVTGTSFAAPFIAGAAALIRQISPNLSPNRIVRILAKTGKPNVDGDREKGPTTGLTFPRLDLYGALRRSLRNAAANTAASPALAASPAASAPQPLQPPAPLFSPTATPTPFSTTSITWTASDPSSDSPLQDALDHPG